MDWLAIYERFIADRRGKEVNLAPGHYDVHHVLPRRLGGGDEPENLIKLSHSDHMFAHIVLARLYPEQMRLAAVMMLNYSKYQGRRSRSAYSALRAAVASDQGERVNRLWSDPNSRLRSREHLEAKSELAKRVWSDPDSAMRSAERNARISRAMKGNRNGCRKVAP